MRGEVHYTLTQVGDLQGVLGAAPAAVVEPSRNITPGQFAPVCFVRGPDRTIEALRWGLLPRWTGHGGKRGPMIHTPPLDAALSTPLLRDAFKRSRCLVIADGCYAQTELKQPIWCHPDPVQPIAFAGVWGVNSDDGVASFALLLGPPLVTRVHDPMPIVLAPEHFTAWLDARTKPDAAAALCIASSTQAVARWRADPVSAIGNPSQGSLF
jgi:putative SOS response-associated peptidase YedK